jgi:hypothetical protein
MAVGHPMSDPSETPYARELAALVNKFGRWVEIAIVPEGFYIRVGIGSNFQSFAGETIDEAMKKALPDWEPSDGTIERK